MSAPYTTSYRLGAGDVLTISIYAGGEEQVNVNLTVSDEGNVNFPFIGSVPAGGMTTSELERAAFTPLEKDYFVDPQIHIQIMEYHSLRFSISGAVAKPGNYEMKSATTLLDLIAMAGGATPERGNVAYILKEAVFQESQANSEGEVQGTDPIKVNLLRLLDEGDMAINITLQTGDSVYIPLSKGLNQSDTKVYVSGEVKRPDVYEYQPGLTALSVCIMAGGFDQYAAPNRTTIVRFENGKQAVIKIDLEDVIKGKAKDLSLKPGDRLHVPESWL